MIREFSEYRIIRVMTVTVIVLAAFDAVIWKSILTADVRISATQEITGVASSVKIPENLALPAPEDGVGVPVRIKIPSLDVDAAIEKVALAKDGSMGVPTHPLDAAWYGLGPRPGETGSAAIAGHVNWLRGATGVFKDLHKLKSGDKIAVQDDRGAVISFIVRASRKYGAQDDALDVFSSHDGKAHLNIITCDGVWDKLTNQYSKRLVVFADKETEKEIE